MVIVETIEGEQVLPQVKVKTHLIFVYGTLKRGFGNNRLLESSKFIGSAITVERYTLWSSRIPFLNSTPLHQVTGELYEVKDGYDLQRLDSLEGHPRWYERRPLQVVCEDQIFNAEAYFNDDPIRGTITNGTY